MKPLSRDTDEAAEAVQLELLRKAGPQRRAAMALQLSDTVIALAKRAIREAHPHETDEELAVRFVAIHYGDELAEGLRRHFESVSS